MLDNNTAYDMTRIPEKSSHTFFIPVMGTGFTIDTPLKVARYGISSVLSLGDDNLIEQIRKYQCRNNNEPYEEIPITAEDWRAKRITEYLDLIDRLVKKQVSRLQSSPFETGSEISKYFKMLPDSPLKQAYTKMLSLENGTDKKFLQNQLRKQAIPGRINVNIMCGIDRDLFQHGKKLPPEYSLTNSAVRGYAHSTLDSSIILSAGINTRMYNYIANFSDFYPDKNGYIKKKIVLKVSDYRSAVIQGKLLAKIGLWVSEYRIESGLNCGGHAFATKGLLIGTILEEFKKNKEKLTDQLYALYTKALQKKNTSSNRFKPIIEITAQGGIGTHDEDQLIHQLFEINDTGWGTPFMLVPEAINIDEKHLELLCQAGQRGEDGEYIERELYPTFRAGDLQSLSAYETYVRLSIDGRTSDPFSARTLPESATEQSYREAIIQLSRIRYACNKQAVENQIGAWMADPVGHQLGQQGKELSQGKND